MKEKELRDLKLQFQEGNNEYLKRIFIDHSNYCIQNLQRKFKCPVEDAEDIMMDAIINFRDKVLDDKVQYLTSIRNYLYTTCVNMKREKDRYTSRLKEKERDILLYLYDDNEELIAYNEKLLKLSINSFQELSESCMELLKQFYVYKISMEDLALKMGYANANTAKVTKARCYKKWLEIIKKKEESES